MGLLGEIRSLDYSVLKVRQKLCDRMAFGICQMTLGSHYLVMLGSYPSPPMPLVLLGGPHLLSSGTRAFDRSD